MATYLESLSSMVHYFFNHEKELERSQNGKSKLGADFFLQWLEIYGYTQFEMRRTLVYKFSFTPKQACSCDQLPRYNLIVKK